MKIPEVSKPHYETLRVRIRNFTDFNCMHVNKDEDESFTCASFTCGNLGWSNMRTFGIIGSMGLQNVVD